MRGNSNHAKTLAVTIGLPLERWLLKQPCFRVQVSRRRLISTIKAAERLNVSPNTIRQFIADGKFKGYKVGRLIKLDANEIEAYLDRVASN